MKLIWKITLHEMKYGYQVRLDGEHGSSIGKGTTPHAAYRDQQPGHEMSANSYSYTAHP